MTKPAQAETLREPDPIWSELGRFHPEEPLPPYRFVLGLNPHPMRHPEGHSYGVREEVCLPETDQWRECGPYLYGIDLYHHAYFWEAHEEWEGLWKQAAPGSPQRLFLQGLIMLTAAQLKLSWGSVEGGRRLSRTASKRLGVVLEHLSTGQGQRFMGIVLPDLLADVERYWKPVWDGSDEPIGRPPALIPG